MDKITPALRNYDEISPSAKALVLLKGLTNIPFATRTAELISFPVKYEPEFDNPDIAFWKRVVHFEIRYWSIDQLLSELSTTNILELSSGFSFRGLETVKKKEVVYMDTDLPDLIKTKKDILESLLLTDEGQRKGHLELEPLNALDEERFVELIRGFPEGPVVIINEGLLMYLSMAEKTKLCQIIHKVLSDRGGYWITGDIYRRSSLERIDTKAEDSLKELVDKQNIEANMFDDFESAEDFFRSQGFVINKAAQDDFSRISSLRYLMSNATPTQLQEMQTQPKVQLSWRLEVNNR